MRCWIFLTRWKRSARPCKAWRYPRRPSRHWQKRHSVTAFGEEHVPVSAQQLLRPRRREDQSDDLWTTYQRVQENLIKGGLYGQNRKGQRTHTRAVKGIDSDVKLNRALWVMAEKMLTLA